MALGLFAPDAPAAESSVGPPPWPAVDSDLTPAPGLREGTLPNGLRYLILPNAEPQGRISARLLVAAGSVHEQDDEQGLAHFVEHMAFRGTSTHPADSLTAVLQRLGVGRGPDNTAFTSYEHTIFHLELPDDREQTLREGLRIFREYSEEISFEPRFIAQERGVVLAELATRDVPSARNGFANLAFLFPAARQLNRQPVGTADAIRRFTREQCRMFYDAWYRPERMAVILVGPLDPDAAARLVAAEFAGLKARAPARPHPADLIPPSANSPDVAVYAEPGLFGLTLTFEHPLATPRIRNSGDERHRQLRRGLAFAMFQSRLTKLTLDPACPFVSPQVAQAAMVPGWTTVGLSVSGRVDDWRRVFAEVEQEHRRAYYHGFSETELTEARLAAIASVEQAVRTERTWSSSWLAGRLADCLLSGTVFVTASQSAPEALNALRETTVEQCEREFRAAWSSAAPHVFISANPSFRIQPEEIGAALNESRQTEVGRRPEQPTAAEFAYTDFGPAGRLVRDEEVADLALRLTRFANGVRCNFKSTPFDADTVDVNVRVGTGKLGQPEDRPGLELLANGMVLAGGLGRHSIEELGRIMSSTTVRPAFAVETDACVFSVRCARRDLGVAFRLVAAYLTDAAFRPDALRTAQASLGSMYQSLYSSPAGPLATVVGRTLAAGDRRFGMPTMEELGARTLAEVRTWLEPQFRRGAIEVSVVGDVTWPEVAAAAAGTIGALPARPERPQPAVRDRVKPPRPPIAPTVLALDLKVKQGAVAWHWPGPETADIHIERRCRLLAALLAERLRIRLRDTLGATYTPTAGYTVTNGFPGMNHFSCYAEVDPAKLNQAMQLIEREVTDLAWRGPAEDEFERAKAPFVRGMTDDLRTNAYWGRTVLADAQQEPTRLAAVRDRATDIAAITRADLAALAKLLEPGRGFRYATIPTRPPVYAAPKPPPRPAAPPANLPPAK